MKSLLKFLLPVLLLVFILAPGVTGYLVESAVNKNKDGIANMMRGGPFSLLDNEFRRGWFNSDQTTELRIDDPRISATLRQLVGSDLDAEMPTLLVQTRATHGVIPVTSPDKGGFRPAIAQAESELFLKYGSRNMEPLPLTLYSSVGVANWAKLETRPFIRTIGTTQGPVIINWQRGTLEASLGKSVSVAGDFGPLTLRSDDGQLRWESLEFQTKYNAGIYAFPQGESSIHIPAADFEATNGDALSLQDMDAEGRMEVVNGRARANAAFESGAISLPGLDINTASMAMQYDVDAMMLSAVFLAMREQRAAASLPDARAPDSAKLLAALGELAKGGGSLSLDKFDLVVNGEKVQLEFDIKVPSGHNDPVEALRNGVGKGQFVIPQLVVDLLSAGKPEIANAVQMGAGFGFLKKHGNSYSTEFSYEDGILTLNELPLPLPF